MKLDNLVTTLEQSQKIKELGFEEKSYFLRQKEYDERPIVVGPEILLGGYEKAAQYYHCYTAEELGEILPERVTLSREGDIREARHIIPNIENIRVMVRTGPTLAQAMGDMLIYLLENNLLPTNETDE